MQKSFSCQPLDTRKKLVKAMVGRMANAYGVKKSALHGFLGCTAGLVNNWVYHGRIPYDYLEACSLTTGVSMDWLLYGETPGQRLHSEDIDWLAAQHEKVLKDGLEYGMIEVESQSVIARMVKKFKKDLWSRRSQNTHKKTKFK